MPEPASPILQRSGVNVSDRDKLTVGIVGYDGEDYDYDELLVQLYQAFEVVMGRYPNATEVTLLVLSGSRGVPALACYFAVNYGWQTMAITSATQSPSDSMPIRQYFTVASDADIFGIFLEKSDVLLRVGGSQLATEAVIYFRKCGGELYEYEIATYPS